jgi:hypothetical protein
MSERGEKGGAALPAWIAIGAGIGVALGVAMDNMPLWLAVGIGLGVAIGALATRSRRGDG